MMSQQRSIRFVASCHAHLDATKPEDQRSLVSCFHTGFRTLLDGLVDDGLATAEREVVTGPNHTAVEVVRIRITEVGLRALEE